MTYGGRSPDARTVIVYGNCQSPVLARILATIDDLNDDLRFVYVPNHPFPSLTELEALPEKYLRDVALVLEQHEERNNNPYRLALQSRLPPGVQVIKFPSFIMSSMWPFECPEPRGQSEPDYPWRRFMEGDMIGLEIAKSGLSGPLALAAYLDLSVKKMPDLAVRLQRDIDRMRRYDDGCDVKVSDFVEANFRKQYLFWSSGHIAEAGMIELVRRTATVLRPILGGTEQRLEECLEAAKGFEGMGNLQVPIHPIVAGTLGLEFWRADQAYRWYAQNWTFYEYIERYIAYDTNW
jgi:hypothetical protein